MVKLTQTDVPDEDRYSCLLPICTYTISSSYYLTVHLEILLMVCNGLLMTDLEMLLLLRTPREAGRTLYFTRLEMFSALGSEVGLFLSFRQIYSMVKRICHMADSRRHGCATRNTSPNNPELKTL